MPMIEHQGSRFWMPSMSPKGLHIALNQRQRMLLHGSRKSTKSNTCQNMLMLHAAMNEARCGIFLKFMKGSAGSGVWPQICGERNSIVSQWNDDPEGFKVEYVKKPTMMADTKMRYFTFKNQLGTASEVQMHTIPNEWDVEDFVKDQAFTFIYIVEANRFKNPELVSALSAQLRAPPPLAWELRRIVLDCNPPIEGTKHWLYDQFIRNEKGQYVPDVDERTAEHSFGMDDNPFIDDSEKRSLFLDYSRNQNTLDRLYYGRWVAERAGTLFAENFREAFHVRGNKGDDPTVLVPNPRATEMPTGFDLGDAKNHAAVICSKRLGDNGPIYDIIDELVIINKNFPISDFATKFETKMTFWEGHLRVGKRTPKWKFWSDSSSLRYLAIANGSIASAIYQQTEGKIALRGVRKGSGSVKQRIEMLRRILNEERIFISISCKHTIEMLEFIKSGEGSELIEEESPYKHVFDALTYMLGYEEPKFMHDFGDDKPTVSGLVTI